MRLLLLIATATLSAQAELSIKQSPGHITILDGETLVTEYRTDAPVPYLYPISSPGGANLARHWPMSDDAKGEEKDHPHHRSFWLSHGSVNDHDFWAWTTKDNAKIIHKSFTSAEVKNNIATFSADLEWNAAGKTILTEKRSYALSHPSATTCIIDITSTLTASQEDVTLGDTKEGFVAFRVDRTLRLKGPTAAGHIVDDQGRKDEDCWGKRSAWVTFYGPDDQGKSTTITLMDHSDNLRHPTWWHARDYGLLAANPFGIHDFESKKDKTLGNHTIKKGESLTFRYRLVLHAGTPETATTKAHYSEFTKK